MQLYGTRARYSGALQRARTLRAPSVSTPQRRGGTYAIISEASKAGSSGSSADIFRTSESTGEDPGVRGNLYQRGLRRYLGSLSGTSHTDEARLNAIMREVAQTLQTVKALRNQVHGLPPAPGF